MWTPSVNRSLLFTDVNLFEQRRRRRLIIDTSLVMNESNSNMCGVKSFQVLIDTRSRSCQRSTSERNETYVCHDATPYLHSIVDRRWSIEVKRKRLRNRTGILLSGRRRIRTRREKEHFSRVSSDLGSERIFAMHNKRTSNGEIHDLFLFLRSQLMISRRKLPADEGERGRDGENEAKPSLSSIFFEHR